MKRAMTLAVLVLLSVSTGCARLNSIHRTDNLSWFAGKIIHTDAKQRAILAAKKRKFGSDGKLVEQHWQFCTEPPPDVFSTLASSLSGRASLAESGDPLSKEIAAELSAALSENAATIERTQTVNILRESMYRTCERFLSGGIGTTEFIVQSARDQRAMVAVLAIEQLTGVQKAQSTALTTVAKAAADGVSEKSLEILEKAKNEAELAKRTAVAKRDEAKSIEPNIDCGAAKDSEEPDHADKKKACEDADALESALKAAEAYFSTVQKAVENQASLSAEAKGTLHTAALNGSAANQNIADRVVEITQQVSDFDELGMTCVVIFRLVADSKLDFNDMDIPLRDACLGRVEAEVALSAERIRYEAAEFQRRADEIQSELRSKIEGQARVVWNQVFDGSRVDVERLDELISRSGRSILPSDKRVLVSAKTLKEFTEAFAIISPDTRSAIANTAEASR